MEFNSRSFLIVFCTEKEREDRALRRKLLIETRELGHFTCHERRTCSSCLAFCSTDPRYGKTSWVAYSYSVSSIIFFGLKIIGHGDPDNNLETTGTCPKIIILIFFHLNVQRTAKGGRIR
jgi:hypothetical protein